MMRMLGLVVLLTSSLLIAQPTHAGEVLRAGVAVVDITPPVPFRMSGYFYERLSTGVKGPLHARAIVMRQGDESAALVFCDLIGVPASLTSRARQRASEATGIPQENIAITATHTHTGPLYYNALSEHLHQRKVEQEGLDPYNPQDYVNSLTDNIVAVIVQANSAIEAVELQSGVSLEERVSFNRRFFMKDGSVRFNPGPKNPNIVRPAGPIDPQVGVVLFSPVNGAEPFAAIVSFALHLDTVGGTEYSADYPKYIEQSLRELFGPKFTLLFGTGTCGDINHIDISQKDRRSAEEIGTMLGESILQTINHADSLTTALPRLAVRSTKIDAPLQIYTKQQVAKARENMNLINSRELEFLEKVKAYKITDLQTWTPPSISLEVQAFRLNDETAIVTLPAEVFVELGLKIKAASPFKTTLVIELANDSLGYIPTKKAFAEGSYETVNSRVQPGTGEQLVEAAVALLKELK